MLTGGSFGFALVAASLLAAPATGQVRLSQEQALRLAFPEPAVIERRTAFLGEAPLARARQLAGPGVEITQGVVTYYVARRDGRHVGTAYFDAHRVRSLREVLMIVVDPADRVERIEVLAFQEPPEYLPPAGWLDQLDGRLLDDDLSLRRGIVGMTGATLSAEAVVRATRRVLALHQVIRP
jgi:hypothetical protein